MSDPKPAVHPLAEFTKAERTAVRALLEVDRDRGERLARGIGCTAVMLRVYKGKHPKQPPRSEKK